MCPCVGEPQSVVSRDPNISIETKNLDEKLSKLEDRISLLGERLNAVRVQSANAMVDHPKVSLAKSPLANILGDYNGKLDKITVSVQVLLDELDL